jgi:tetratricopeptide (TPR) repeat protein
MSRFNNLEFGDQFEERAVHFPAPKDGPYHLAQAHSALERGRFEEALRAYSKVLEFDPDCAAAWTGQVRMLIELGEFQEARLWADKALERFPSESELLAAKAVALARAGDLQGAMSFSDSAVEAQGSTPYIWLARADVLLARAEKRADFCLEKALALAARDWMVHWLACRVYCYYKKFSRALQLAQKALEIDATRAVIWLQLGRCQLAMGLSHIASVSFQRAEELDPLCQPGTSDRAQLAGAGFWTRLRGWWRHTFDA